MIELKRDELVFSFPEVHHSASMRISFERTIRIPDDDKDYPLPPALGKFPLRHVDDLASNVPAEWLKHGGVVFPMYQSEAMWLYFDAHYDVEREASYPFAIKIATGKVNAVSGGKWTKGIRRSPRQDYVVVPKQPWLDGYCVAEGVIRQFVAMPLGSGYSAEEQVSGKAEHGGLQIEVFPMKAAHFEKYNPKRDWRSRGGVLYEGDPVICCYESAMGLAPGGSMKQKIEKDPYNMGDWDTTHSSRCFAHITNSMVWHGITGEHPPHPPPTAKEYNAAGFPWFEWYDEKSNPLTGSKTLSGLKSVSAIGKNEKQKPLPENESIEPANTVVLHPHKKPGQVREFEEV